MCQALPSANTEPPCERSGSQNHFQWFQVLIPAERSIVCPGGAADVPVSASYVRGAADRVPVSPSEPLSFFKGAARCQLLQMNNLQGGA